MRENDEEQGQQGCRLPGNGDAAGVENNRMVEKLGLLWHGMGPD